jgi:hypothetical protein
MQNRLCVCVASVLYVSPTGRSRSLLNRGSLDNPFWSVGEAIEHINGTELATVVLKGGSYVGPQNVNLTFTGLNIAFVYVYNKYHSAESVKESLPLQCSLWRLRDRV